MAIEKIDTNLCNGCGTCIKSCPVDVLRFDKVNMKAVVQYPEECMLCGWCRVCCLQNAVIFTLEKKSPLLVSWG